MPKIQTKKHKPSKTRHRFIHHCRTGNTCEGTFVIPNDGQTSEFTVDWKRRATAADRMELLLWQDHVSAELSRLAGRFLNVCLYDLSMREPMAIV